LRVLAAKGDFQSLWGFKVATVPGAISVAWRLASVAMTSTENSNALAATEGAAIFFTRGHAGRYLPGESSGSLVGHINRASKVGPLKIGVRNVHHETLKNDHEATNFMIGDNGFVKDVLEHGPNLGFIIGQVKEEILQIFKGWYTNGDSRSRRFWEG
jgi:hypothetical protein